MTNKIISTEKYSSFKNINYRDFISIKNILFLPIRIFLITLDLFLFKKMSRTFKAKTIVIKDSIDIYESQSKDNERFNNNEFRYSKLKLAIDY